MLVVVVAAVVLEGASAAVHDDKRNILPVDKWDAYAGALDRDKPIYDVLSSGSRSAVCFNGNNVRVIF